MTDEPNHSEPTPLIRRRDLLGFGAAAVCTAALLTPTEALAGRFSIARQIKLNNLNTGERLNAEYWVRGRYLPDAMRAVDWVLRDHRTDQQVRIDPHLLDLVSALHIRLEAGQPFDVICGYRSRSTNAMMRIADRGIAINSYHMSGKAVDVNLPGLSLTSLARAARSMNGGGVGYYPVSDFVHLDIGPIRHW